MAKPVIFLGSNLVLDLYTETLEEQGRTVAGIMDSDYWGNTHSLHGLPVLASEAVLLDPDQVASWRDNYEFFCAVNWQPVDDPVAQRNTQKRLRLLDVIDQSGVICTNIIDSRAKISRTVRLGQGIYIGEFCVINPHTVIQDHVNIYGHTSIGHHVHIGRNTVIQRRSCVTGEMTLESNVFVSSHVTLLKNHATIGQGSFIHECIYLRRGTVANETVSLQGPNLRRVRAQNGLVD